MQLNVMLCAEIQQAAWLLMQESQPEGLPRFLTTHHKETLELAIDLITRVRTLRAEAEELQLVTTSLQQLGLAEESLRDIQNHLESLAKGTAIEPSSAKLLEDLFRSLESILRQA